MNPKTWDFVFTLLEVTAREAYKLGYADAEAKKPMREQGFTPSRATKLTLQTKLKKHVESR
jgi:hypothetical protein